MARFWTGIGAAALLLACGAGAQRRREVTILAAPALAHALTALQPAFEQERRGLTAVVRTGAFAEPDPAGEPLPAADVVATDDVDRVRRMHEAGAFDRPRIIARSRMAVLVPARNPGGIRTPRDLARPGVRLVAGAAQSPIGAHTRRLLERLERVPGYPQDFSRSVEERIVSRAQDVDGALERLSLGEGHAAIGYEADARASRRLRVVDLPPGVEVEVEFVAAVHRSATHLEDAGAVMKVLLSTRGRDTLRRHGFR